MSIVTAVSAARPAQVTPDATDPAALPFVRTGWGPASYAAAVESAARPSRLAASGMATTETPTSASDGNPAKRRLEVMEEVAARLARLAQTSRSDLAARAVESLRQRLKLLKMQAMAAILRGDRRAALVLADELAQVARAIEAAERDQRASSGGTVASIPVTSVTVADLLSPLAGTDAAEVALPPRPSLDGAPSAEVADVTSAARGLATESPRAASRLSTLVLFDTSRGPGTVADEAAGLIRVLRRAAHRATSRPGTFEIGARNDAAGIAMSLGTAGLLGLAAAG